MAKRTASDIMEKAFITASPETSVFDLVNLFVKNRITAIPIINDKIRALARKEAMEIFGGNFDEIIIGGAPFNAEVERFLKQIGFPYTIAYGMTECGPIICSSRWETLKLAAWK